MSKLAKLTRTGIAWRRHSWSDSHLYKWRSNRRLYYSLPNWALLIEQQRNSFFSLFSLEASKLLTLLVNLWKGSSSLIMGIFRLVYRVCWYSKIAILPQMCSKIVWIWYFGVCLKLTIFSRPNIFFFFFQRSFLFDIWEFAWSWQPTTVAEFQIGAKWSSTAHQRENFKLQILKILRNIHKITNKIKLYWCYVSGHGQ